MGIDRLSAEFSLRRARKTTGRFFDPAESKYIMPEQAKQVKSASVHTISGITFAKSPISSVF
jgi:hypothetical protein